MKNFIIRLEEQTKSLSSKFCLWLLLTIMNE